MAYITLDTLYAVFFYIIRNNNNKHVSGAGAGTENGACVTETERGAFER